MKNWMGLGLALILALTGLQACSDDSGSGGGGTDTATSDTTAGGDSTAGGDAIDAAADVSVVAAKDECQNTADKTWLTTDQGGKKGRDLASSAASKCGLGCLSKPDPNACTVDCMLGPEKVALSKPCAGCYGGIVVCTIKNCVSKCVADPSATTCTDCQKEKGCTDAFYTCTGKLD